jgi:hypothetical protein
MIAVFRQDSATVTPTGKPQQGRSRNVYRCGSLGTLSLWARMWVELNQDCTFVNNGFALRRSATDMSQRGHSRPSHPAALGG